MRSYPINHPLWTGTMLCKIRRVDEALDLPESAQIAIRKWLADHYVVGEVHPVLGTACWNWRLSKFKTGYGVLNLKNTSSNVHRLAYVMSKGRVGNLHVLHSCDNRQCINPKHLWLGTNVDNVRDRESKGRNVISVGESHGCAKLTDDDVRELRRRYIKGSSIRGLKAMSKEFGISVPQAARIVNGQNWKHIT